VTTVHVPAWLYRQFDADPSRDVPAEAYGGWTKVDIDLDLDHTALVVMHAWDAGTPDDFPGWYRHVEYIPRANRILKDVFPGMLAAARASGLRVVHVVSGGKYYKHLPGYVKTRRLAWWRQFLAGLGQGGVHGDASRKKLDEIRAAHAGGGANNQADIKRGFERLDFPPEARPLDTEAIAENSPQLLALCKKHGVNHLVYSGFAINWCLLLSPGGMADMSRHGVMCGVIRQATTAVENKETARGELGKENALWRVALAFGFVFDLDDFLRALPR
jgi:nicotinamidase-related amidase